jgi:Polyketide cyclase / dehydrase and lipid transport
MARDYLFIDEWDVDAPQDAVFHALADAGTYPDWWRPVYIDVESDGPPQIGCVTQQHFKGRLPYTLRTRSEIVRYEPPNTFEVDVVGDLTGKGVWHLTPRDGKVHIRFDWRVIADRPLLRYLTPVLRPVFRWNHNWSVKRAIEGLEPYARSHPPQPG